MTYTVVTPIDASAPSFHAFDFAAHLVQQLLPPTVYRLVVVYVTALNRASRFPYFDHLDRAYNLEIQEEARTAIQECKLYLQRFDEQVSYEFIEIEGEGEVGPLLEKYLADHVPECNLVVVGTHGYHGLKKMIYGSVSEYCVAHLPCPVTVVKGPPDVSTRTDVMQVEEVDDGVMAGVDEKTHVRRDGDVISPDNEDDDAEGDWEQDEDEEEEELPSSGRGGSTASGLRQRQRGQQPSHRSSAAAPTSATTTSSSSGSSGIFHVHQHHPHRRPGKPSQKRGGEGEEQEEDDDDVEEDGDGDEDDDEQGNEKHAHDGGGVVGAGSGGHAKRSRPRPQPRATRQQRGDSRDSRSTSRNRSSDVAILAMTATTITTIDATPQRLEP